MMDRFLFLFTFASLGALAYGWYYNNNRISVEHEKVLSSQQEIINNFMSKGPRFTAQDGYELCEKVKILARYSIGFQQSGLQLPDCEKYINQ